MSGPGRLRTGARAVVLSGVVAACTLGVTAGIWARPHTLDLKAAAPQAPDAPRAGILIVVDDELPPLGQPLEVLTAPEPAAPARSPPALASPDGLVKVAAPSAPTAPEPFSKLRLPEPQTAVAEPAPKARPAASKPKDKPAPKAKPKAAASEKAKPAPNAKATAKDRARPVRTAAAKSGPDKAAVAKATKVKKAATKPARTKPADLKLAKAEPKASKPVRAPSKAVSAKRTEAQPKPVERKVAQAAKPRREAVPAPRAAPPTDRRMACVGRTRAEAMLCADPQLEVAERRMIAAYRRAEAAGVHPVRLRRQQAQWLSVREAAAHEAPWAVARVYEALIAELEDEAGAAWNR